MARLVKLTFLGDLLCQREQITAVAKAKCGYDVVFEGVKHLWKDSDYVVGNLETPVAGKKLRYTYEAMRFNAPESFLTAIRDSGIHFLSTANNHALDRGVAGVNGTLRNLVALGLEHDGTFETREQSEQVFVKEIGGLRVAFISCTYGTNQGLKCNFLPDDELWRVAIMKYPEQVVTTKSFLVKRFVSNLIPARIKGFLRRGRGRTAHVPVYADSVPLAEFGKPEHERFVEAICSKIARANKVADLTVLLPHMGGQYNAVPGPWQMRMTETLVGAGADLVVTNHAHTPLGIGRIGRVPVAYALGNFCFTPGVGFYNAQCQADYSEILHCWVDGQTRQIVKLSVDLAKSVTRADGVSVVVPVTSDDVQGKIVRERMGLDD